VAAAIPNRRRERARIPHTVLTALVRARLDGGGIPAARAIIVGPVIAARRLRSARLLPIILAVALALAGCGGNGGDAPADEATSAQAPLRDGENFHPNDLADCLLDAGVGAGVALDGAALELHDATAQVIVEQGDGDIMVYSDADAAAAREDRYRASFGDLSEVARVRNVLVQTDPELAPEAKAGIDDCLGA
jgi:hypothetical protein